MLTILFMFGYKYLLNSFTCLNCFEMCRLQLIFVSPQRVTHKSLYTSANLSLHFCIILHAFVKFLMEILACRFTIPSKRKHDI